MADSNWSDDNTSRSTKKGRGKNSGNSSSGGGDPYSILTVLRGALSGGGKQGQSSAGVEYKRGGKIRKAKGRAKKRGRSSGR